MMYTTQEINNIFSHSNNINEVFRASARLKYLMTYEQDYSKLDLVRLQANYQIRRLSFKL